MDCNKLVRVIRGCSFISCKLNKFKLRYNFGLEHVIISFAVLVVVH